MQTRIRFGTQQNMQMEASDLKFMEYNALFVSQIGVLFPNVPKTDTNYGVNFYLAAAGAIPLIGGNFNSSRRMEK